MTWYETFLWLHITMAIVWIGGAVMIQAFALRILAAKDGARMAEFSRDVEFIGMRLFTPASLVLLLTGIGLVLNGNWDWGEPYISVGLVVWLLSFLTGILYLGPEGGRIAKAIDADGPESPEAQRRIGNILRYSRIELLLLLVVVFMMTVKLGT
jgi:uncharacterized membrane protein